MYEIFYETFNSVENSTVFQIDGIPYRLSKPLYSNIQKALKFTFKLPILNRSIVLDTFIIHLQGNFDFTDAQNINHSVEHTILKRLCDDRLFVLRTSVFYDLFIDIN
jgi:hypothetical protein